MFFLLVIMCVLFGSTFIFGSIAMQNAEPIFFIAIRMLISGSLMLGYLLLSRNSCKIHRKDIKLFLLLGGVHILIPYVGEFWALQYISAAKTSLIWSLSPFVTAIFAWFMFEEKMTPLKLVGMVIGFLGFIPIIMYQGTQESGLATLYNFSTADLALVIAVVSAAFAWSSFKKLMHKGYRPLLINGWAMLIGGLYALILSPFFESWSPVPVRNWPVVLGCLAMLVIVGGFVCYNLYGYLLKKYTVTFLAFAGGFIPFCTAGFQWLLLGQPVSVAFLISIIIISSGLYIFYKEELRQGYIK